MSEYPVHHTPLGVWMLSRYDDCFALLRNPSLSVEIEKAAAIDPDAATPRADQFRDLFPELEDEAAPGGRGILSIDPPDHTRIRRLMSKVFTPRRVESLRPHVQQLVDGMLDDVDEAGGMDVIADLAFPLPFTVISEMLGMPTADRDQLRDRTVPTPAVCALLDPIISDDEIRAAVHAGMRMRQHCAEVIEWKRANPADDLLSALIQAEDEGDTLSSLTSALDQVVLLFIAGHETTVNLIGNGTLRLLQHPDQLARVQADPSGAAVAVDELLRYDSPVQFSRRITLEALDIDGTTIPAGQFVMTCLGAANHDPAQFGETADELDVGREGANRNLSFGSGIHHCLGAALARLEGQVAIGTLVRRFPDLALATEAPPWNGRIVLRGLDHLPVMLH
ncbi:MAG: cytochrome P450 [Acidimicrobiia bacterium]|nr:cytochrome P450 [Acidimicrobiia bacterium]